MKSRPILFQGDMVRAILDGRKTQTRRVVKPQPPGPGYTLGTLMDTTSSEKRRHVGKRHWVKVHDLDITHDHGSFFRCPYGQPGDLLWVRETWLQFADRPSKCGMADSAPENACVDYRADYALDMLKPGVDSDGDEYPAPKWHPSIHMPRWASRLTLRVTGVRVEQVQEISEEDATAEGIERSAEFSDRFLTPAGDYATPAVAFQRLWESINGADSWRANPWVWVIEFESVQANVDQVLEAAA